MALSISARPFYSPEPIERLLRSGYPTSFTHKQIKFHAECISKWTWECQSPEFGLYGIFVFERATKVALLALVQGDLVCYQESGPPPKKGEFKWAWKGLRLEGNQVVRCAIVQTVVQKDPPRWDGNGNEMEYLKWLQRSSPSSSHVKVHGVASLGVQEWEGRGGVSASLSHFIAILDWYPMSMADLRQRSSVPLEPWVERCKRDLPLKLLEAVLPYSEQGIVHRDVTPSNLLFDPYKEQLSVVLVDFTFATPQEGSSPPICPQPHPLCTPGTTKFLSPEYAVLSLEIHSARQARDEQKMESLRNSYKEYTKVALDAWGVALTVLQLIDPATYLKLVQRKDESFTTYCCRLTHYHKIGKISDKEGGWSFEEPAKGSRMHWVWRMLCPRPEERLTLLEAIREEQDIRLREEPKSSEEALVGM